MSELLETVQVRILQEVEDLKKSAKTSDEQEKLLQSFSSNTNSNSNSFTSNMAGYLIATEAYVR